MGKPKVTTEEIQASGAVSREVYFQAVTFFTKVNRLSFEQTRSVAAIPETPKGDIKPQDVLDLVNAGLERLRFIKTELKIKQAAPKVASKPSVTPTDVFRSMVQLNRQLNLLLDDKFTPAEVYEQVSLGIGYAARLRSAFPGDRIPESPAIVPGKTPQDVYRQLYDCFTLIKQIADTSDLSMLDLKLSENSLDTVSPSDVYDIASLLISELAFLHSTLESAPPPRKSVYPGRKIPSEVYQRSKLLELQLQEIHRLATSQPDRLRRVATDKPSSQN